MDVIDILIALETEIFYYARQIIVILGVFSLLSLILFIKYVRKKNKLKSILMVICILLTGVGSGILIHYELVNEDIKNMVDNPNYEPKILDPGERVYVYRLPESNDMSKYEPLTIEEWQELKQKKEPFTKKELMRILRTFPDDFELERYIHTYGYIMNNYHVYELYRDIELNMDADFKKYDKEMHEKIKSLQEVYSIVHYYTDILLYPPDAAEFTLALKQMDDAFFKLQLVNDKNQFTLETIEDHQEYQDIKEVDSVLESLKMYYEKELTDYKEDFKEIDKNFDVMWGELQPLLVERVDALF